MIKKMKHHTRYALILALAGACIMTGCKNKHEKIDSAESSATQAETMAETSAAPTTAATETTPEIAIPATDTTTAAGSSTGNSKNVTTSMNTYTSGKISIQYPAVVNLADSAKAAAIDSLLKDNALSVIQAYEADDTKDTLTITCKVLSANNNRITATYSGSLHKDGAAHPLNLFYSNTIDVKQAANLGFKKYADPYTMAGYVMSNDCLFLNKSPEETAALRTWLHTEGTLDSYTQLFNQADFPTGSTFPASFSYEHEGTIFFSVPVNHALGDYAIVMFTPENK